MKMAQKYTGRWNSLSIFTCFCFFYFSLYRLTLCHYWMISAFSTEITLPIPDSFNSQIDKQIKLFFNQFNDRQCSFRFNSRFSKICSMCWLITQNKFDLGLYRWTSVLALLMVELELLTPIDSCRIDRMRALDHMVRSLFDFASNSCGEALYYSIMGSEFTFGTVRRHVMGSEETS